VSVVSPRHCGVGSRRNRTDDLEDLDVTATSSFPQTKPPRSLPKWAIPAGVAAAVLLLVVLPAIGARNGLVNKEEAVNTQFSQVDVQLQRRFDLIPNAAESVKAVLKQEQTVFIEIANARARYGSASSADQKIEASNQLDSALGRLLVIVENNPTLNSDKTVRDFMVVLEGSENRISQERRVYNEKVQDYNVAVRRFPGSIAAALFGFDRKPLFVGTPGSNQVPKVDLNVNPTPSPSAG
jgi:LemA protein